MSLVRSVLLYGSEAWKITKVEEKILNAFQYKCLMRILTLRWQVRVTNEEVRTRTNTNEISELRRRA